LQGVPPGTFNSTLAEWFVVTGFSRSSDRLKPVTTN
jgi:hypothetical protein